MRHITRRAALSVGATLATATAARKLWPSPAYAQQDSELGQLQLRDPPRRCGGLGFTGADGAAHRIAEFAGSGVVLNLWATWCGPCVTEMPSLAALARQLAADRIEIIPVSSDTGGAGAVRRFYQTHRIEGLGIWLDHDDTLVDAVGAPGLPTTLIIDRRGREIARISGATDWTGTDAAATVRILVEA